MTQTKEIIKIVVRVEIHHDKNDKRSRKEAIEVAKKNVLSTSTWGHPIMVEPLTSKLLIENKKN